VVSQENQAVKLWGEVTADLLKRLGMKVDYAAVDNGTLAARLGQKRPPGQGGWQIAPTDGAGVRFIDPTNRRLRADGENVQYGSANIPQVEAEIAAWYEATSLDEEKAIARRLNKAAFDHVLYAPLGWYLKHQAWRKNVSGIVPGPSPFFWGVSKTV
jgi:peptide/nickel transport system substrate-binding protein